MIKISNVKAHKKLLKDGKLHYWSAHTRQLHNGRTEANTEEHVLFKELFEFVINHNMNIRDTLMLSSDDFIDSIKQEVALSGEFLTNDKRVTDILIITKNGRNICIECQISTLSSFELYERTFDYLSNGYEVIWVRKPGRNYQYIYYWLMDDCNRNRSYGKKRNFQLSENIADLCEDNYFSEIEKSYGYILIKFLKR